MNRLNSLMLGSSLIPMIAHAAVAEAGNAKANAKAEKPAEKPDNVQAKADAHCREATEAAIKSSKNHEATLKDALTSDIIFGLTYGRYEHLTALFNGVSLGDQEAIRFFMVNVARTHGYKPDETKPKLVKLPFVYKKDKKQFESAKGSSDDERKMIAASKASIIEAGAKGISVLSMGRSNVSNDNAGTEIDPYADLVKAIERAASRGAKQSILEQIAKPLDAMGYHAAIADKVEKAKGSESKVAKLERQLAAEKAKLAKNKETEKTTH